MKEPNRRHSPCEHGISVVELLIVAAMISVVTTFAVMQIAGAQRAMRLTNSAREFMAWLEKARMDSLRRHPMSSAEMASVEITSANSYSITIDQNGDGALDPPRNITIPAGDGTTFSGVAVPSVIRFNWRGRPVDDLGNTMSLSFSLRSTVSGVSPVPINLTSDGDTSLYDNINAGAVSINDNSVGTANVKKTTKIP